MVVGSWTGYRISGSILSTSASTTCTQTQPPTIDYEVPLMILMLILEIITVLVHDGNTIQTNKNSDNDK